VPEKPEESKIRVDSDWKQRAQETKKQISQEEETAEAGSPSRAALPPPTLATHLSQLITEAVVALGDLEHPVTKKQMKDLDLARYLIDTLDMLKQKTEGNRDEEENRMLEGALYNLRMRYVDTEGKTETGTES